AMAEAEVGDDVFREDPTVRRLEELAAETMGKGGALFVPTGTMGNQVAINVWTRPGREVILEERSHIFNYEMGTMAAFSGVLPRPLQGQEGALTAEAVRRAIRPDLYYLAQTGLITLENTHNMAGGTILPRSQAEAICALARERRIPVHLDGARLFNAAVAQGVAAAELARPFDSVMTCLSKGLGAPVGSVLAGSADFVAEALKVRKRLGGGMRQAGVLAAAGIIALRDHVGRLAEDHVHARLLAERVAATRGLSIDPAKVQTNIVIFELTAATGMSAQVLAQRWKEAGVLALALDERQVRAVTHYDVDRAGIEAAGESLDRIMRSGP
ncbi:MAG TPA: GntG family PLP-dependent aldolase, partial [Candidatus Polarisedimenticolia bacterium]|nr:GntG family PLP-dependent aldolase [Candidatus Polarisedimenticolia bacterium]